MSTEFRIGDRKIGPDQPPLVMPEVGINHEGQLDMAMQCVDAAVEAGAECIKFQCHITEEEMIPTDMKPGEISDESLWDIIKRCELTAEEERRVQEYCGEKGIIYLSTPFSKAAADRLEGMNLPAYKIGSGECNNIPLLEHVADFGKPVILSTGMNDTASVMEAVAVFAERNCPLMLMHCTSMYPTPYDRVRLGAITELQEAFGLPVGLSDHSLGIYACLGAVALGACALEKHFAVSRKWPGCDVPLSIEPQELAELVKGSEAVFAATGGGKTILPEEQPVIDFAYASIVTIAPVEAGEVFDKSNTWVKRPGTGPMHARQLGEVLGRKATRNLAAETQISPDDIQA